MAQRLGTQAVLANDLSLNASAHVKSSRSPIHPIHPAPGGDLTSLASTGTCTLGQVPVYI